MITKPKKNAFFCKSTWFRLGCIGVFFLCLNSCGKSVDPTFIPSDANLVFILDFNNLSSKAAGWQEMVDYALGGASSSDTDIINLLTHSGINLSKNAYVFCKISSDISQNYYALSFVLNKPEEFVASLQKNKSEISIQKDGDLNYFMNENLMIGWNKKRALILSQNKSGEALSSKFKEVFSIENSEGLEKNNTEFYNLLSKDFDMGFWMDFHQLVGFEENLPKQQNQRISEMLSELSQIAESTSATIHFEDGKIISHFNNYYNEQLLKKYEKMFRKDGIDIGLLQKIPLKSPPALFAFGVGTQGLREILEEANLLEDVKKISRVFDTSNEQIFDLFTGDAVVALRDLRFEGKLNPYYEVLFGFGIKNRPDLDKLIGQLNGLFIKKKDNYYILKYNLQTYYMVEIDQFLYLSTTESFLKELIEGKERLDPFWVNAAKDHISLSLLNIEQLSTMLPLQVLEGTGYQKNTQEFFSTFESVIGTSEPYQNGISEGTLEIILKDKNRNALSTLLELFKKTSKARKSV